MAQAASAMGTSLQQQNSCPWQQDRYHYSFLLPRDGSAAKQGQAQDTLPAFRFTRMFALLVLREVELGDEVRVTELTHKWTAERWLCREAAQTVSHDLCPRHVGTRAVHRVQGLLESGLLWDIHAYFKAAAMHLKALLFFGLINPFSFCSKIGSALLLAEAKSPSGRGGPNHSSFCASSCIFSSTYSGGGCYHVGLA